MCKSWRHAGLCDRGRRQRPEGPERDAEGLRPDAVVHVAGPKAAGESEEDARSYIPQTVRGTVNLLRATDVCGCGRIMFVLGVNEYAGSEKTRRGVSVT